MGYDDHWQEAIDIDESWTLLELAAVDYGAFRGRLERLQQRELILFAWFVEARVSEIYAVLERAAEDRFGSEDATDDFARGVVASGRAAYEVALQGRLPDGTFAGPTEATWEPSHVCEDRFGRSLPPVGWWE